MTGEASVDQAFPLARLLHLPIQLMRPGMQSFSAYQLILVLVFDEMCPNIFLYDTCGTEPKILVHKHNLQAERCLTTRAKVTTGVGSNN